IPARAARPCAPSPPSRNLPAKTTSTPARRCCILYSWAEPPQFVLVLAGTQFNLSEAWLFFAFQPCFTYSANLDSNDPPESSVRHSVISDRTLCLRRSLRALPARALRRHTYRSDAGGARKVQQ